MGRRTRRCHFELSFQDRFFNKDFFANNEKRGDICDEKSQISPLKRHGKGSLLLPCSKMPIGIFFIFTKIRFSRKAAPCAQSAEKRRKTKKTRENLGFFGWHLYSLYNSNLSRNRSFFLNTFIIKPKY